jgi:RimJ/RimL family protein N-acetyltransferase
MLPLNLRPATAGDAETLLHWRNDSETRRWSRQGSETSPAEHAMWLADSLANASRRLWIAEIDGTAVGTVRADWTAGGIELSWTVAPERRGQGIATTMVRLARQSLPGRVYAYVKMGNQASVHIAVSAGLQFESAHGDFMCYSTLGEPAPTLDSTGGDNVPHRW